MTSNKIYMQEVACRDGFQNEAMFIPTEEKIAIVDQLSECGYAKIEVTSFTSPKAIPALRDAEEVMHRIRRNPDVLYTVLVPNLRGAERAMSCGVDEINLVMSVSEQHNQSNLRMTRERSFEQLAGIIGEVKSTPVQINVSLSCAFGCPMEGDVAQDEVLHWADRFAGLGVHGITLCDTTGMAYPTQVSALFERVKSQFSELELTAHFHNTRGMALANANAAIAVGINRFDASLGGLGGCPYAPGASGNVCTEDMVHMFELMGLDTGIDLPGILAVAARLPKLLGHDVPGQILKAGPRLKLHPVPDCAVSAG